jgi:hypothetical protein
MIDELQRLLIDPAADVDVDTRARIAEARAGVLFGIMHSPARPRSSPLWNAVAARFGMSPGQWWLVWSACVDRGLIYQPECEGWIAREIFVQRGHRLDQGWRVRSDLEQLVAEHFAGLIGEAALEAP